MIKYQYNLWKGVNMKTNDENFVINLAISVGKIMLESGAEIYRVEETIERMISSKIDSKVDVFVLPTGIIVSAKSSTDSITRLERIQSSKIDLEAISRANSFSRIYTQNSLTDEELDVLLMSLTDIPKFSKKTTMFFTGLAGGLFTGLTGGSFLETIITFIASLSVGLILDKLSKFKPNFFIKNIIGGFLIATIGVLSYFLFKSFGINLDYNRIIIGSLMTLVPGVALTNGIRDLISGELIAGGARILEAIFIAIALAFGVGIALQISFSFV
ncbi:threonine/serine exporter [Soehngenia longivitae]|uniref:Threonine/serine exporter n=2 Tax=Soehngenia longivitae TaxID=2562294 RepID=A0A4Z0D5G2_9FIRM|nr:threonine/serine exporter [Soehngenia longivitae]